MNQYIPVAAKITDIVKHTDIEWTFRVSCKTDGVLPGKFYEISIPKFGESPISVSGYGNDYIDFTIRNVGKVTSELFKYNIGDNFFIRGPYGNGFDVSLYEERDIVVVAGGSGLAPVRGIIEYFYNNPNKCKSFKLIAGFRSLEDILFSAISLFKNSSTVNFIIIGGPTTIADILSRFSILRFGIYFVTNPTLPL